MMNHSHIQQSIIKSQPCQRNWDLSKNIPEDDLNLLITAATQCPSKQNIAFYKLHFITNRNLIEQIHSHTTGFNKKYLPNPEYTTNSQTLANLLVVFEKFTDLTNRVDQNRNDQTRNLSSGEDYNKFERDRLISLGVASGYLNLTASLLGYSSGFCSCFNNNKIAELLKINKSILLLIGIGYPDSNRNRREHQFEDYLYPTKPKQPIEIVFHH